MATQVKVDVSGAIKKLKQVEKILESELRDISYEASKIGAEVARLKLDKSVTKWGRYRMKIGRGNSAGRNDTGTMISRLVPIRAAKNASKILARIGWVAPLKYFQYQESGTSKIKAANSLKDGQKAMLNAIPSLVSQMKTRIASRVNK